MRTILAFFLFSSVSVFANMNSTKAGSIWTECIGGNIYTIHVRLSIMNGAYSTDTLHLDYGDGTEEFIPHTQANSNTPTTDGCVLQFDVSHVYSPGNYSVSAIDGKYVATPSMSNSTTVDFCLMAIFTVDPNISCNSSPVGDPLNLDLDWQSGQMNSCVLTVMDAEGDSIVSTVIQPLCTSGGFQFPGAIGGGVFSYVDTTYTFSWSNPGCGGRLHFWNRVQGISPAAERK